MPSNLFIPLGILTDYSHSHSTPCSMKKQHHFSRYFQSNEKNLLTALISTLAQYWPKQTWIIIWLLLPRTHWVPF